MTQRPTLADLAAQRKSEDEREKRARNRSAARNRYERWHVAETLQREPDNWLMTYLDLITLLLALFVVMLALSRVDTDPPEQREPRLALGLNMRLLSPLPEPTWAVALPEIPAHWAGTEAAAAAAAQAGAASGPEAGGAAADRGPQGDAEVLADPAASGPALHAPTREELGLTDLGDAVDVVINRGSVSFRISNELLFASGQATLSADGLPLIKKLAEVLNRSAHPVSVEGHSDPVPILTRQFASNWELSSSRATAVLRELVRNDVEPGRLRAVGYADTQPLERNDTAAGRAANRRVELIMRIVPQAAAAGQGGAAPQPGASPSGGGDGAGTSRAAIITPH